MSDQRRVIYDFGANKGDNLAYYLSKADLVVAVEANPALVETLRARFEREMTEGALVVVPAVLVSGARGEKLPFFVHKSNSVLSQLSTPHADKADQFEMMEVESRAPSEIVRTFGLPWYVKIDLEGADMDCLGDLLSNQIRPEFISVECHTFDVFAALVDRGGYKAFKLVDGASVGQRFSKWPVQTRDGRVEMAFPPHSAGPFGDDLPAPWLTGDSMFYRLASERCGWRDMHASASAIGEEDYVPVTYSGLSIKQSLRTLWLAVGRSIRRRMRGGN